MLKKIPIFVISVLLLLQFVACNKDDDDTALPEYSYASTMVKSFALAKDKNLLANLDTIFFSIDQVNARIFNADSLPYGTRTNKLLVDLTVDGCSVVQLTYSTGSGSKTVDYLTHSTDSIDFSHGPVTLHLVSLDGTAQRDYEIKVNVHQTKPEQFTWTSFFKGELPSALSSVSGQRTVASGDKAYCLTTDGTRYCIATLAPGAGTDYSYESVTFGFEPDIRSFTASDNAFYILDTSGNLYSCTDFAHWKATGQKWHHIYGAYGTQLLGVTNDNGHYYHVRYPSGDRTEVAADMPVSGTSLPVRFTTKWSENAQMLIRGGRTASGTLTGDVYGFDGNSWARISRPEASVSGVEDTMLVPYFVARTDSASWVVTEKSVLMSTGGRDALGRFDDRMLISRDMGITWEIAGTYMQLPGTVPDYADGDALIFSSTFSSQGRSSAWEPVALPALPRGALLMASNASRVSEAVTEWECPMIYLFGVRVVNGNPRPGAYRGVVNMLTFRPIY